MVHLKDTTYPSCHRVTMGCCYKTLDAKTAELASYSQNYCPSGCATQSSTLPLTPHTSALSGSNPCLGLHRLTGMRHMPDFVYELGVRLWQSAYERLPPDSRLRPPNVCILQTYVRSQGDFMRYHTDGRPSYSGEEEKIVQVRGTGCAARRAACTDPRTLAHTLPTPCTYAHHPWQDQDTAVMTYTLGSNWMRFCYKEYTKTGKKPRQFWFPLKAGETLVWSPVRPARASNPAHSPPPPLTARRSPGGRQGQQARSVVDAARAGGRSATRLCAHPPAPDPRFCAGLVVSRHPHPHNGQVFRWTQSKMRRAYGTDYPYRPVPTEAELEQMKKVDIKQTPPDAFKIDEETLAELAALTEAMQVHPVEVS